MSGNAREITPLETLRQRLKADGRLWKLAYAEGLAAQPTTRNNSMTTDPLNEIAIRLGKAEIELAAAKRAEAQALQHLEHCLIVITVLIVLFTIMLVLL